MLSRPKRLSVGSRLNVSHSAVRRPELLEAMPHVIVFTHFNQLAKGPTYVANDDTILLDYLAAKPPNKDSNDSSVVNESPAHVLDKLEQRGYRVVAMSSNATDQFSTYVWTLHKPEEIEPFA